MASFSRGAMLRVAGWAREARLAPGVDRHGNLWRGRRDGPLLSAGSHVDTVPDGGRYDGALRSAARFRKLLFVPLAGGRSHTPDEHAVPADILHAVLVAGHALASVG